MKAPKKPSEPEPSIVARDLPPAGLQIVSGKAPPKQIKKRFLEAAATYVLPEPQDRDPLAEPFWTFAMMVAWVMTRDAVAVKEVWSEWRREREMPELTSIRLTLITVGWQELAKNDVHAEDKSSLLQVIYQGPIVCSKLDAIEAIRKAGGRGDLQGVSVDPHTGTQREVSALSWAAIVRLEDPFAQSISVPTADLLKLWPAAGRPADAQGQPRKSGRKSDQIWDTIQEAYETRCKEIGAVEEGRTDGWATLADVERFIASELLHHERSFAESTVRQHASKFLQGR